MNRDQKAVVIDEIATQINESEAIFAVDYRGITVEQVAALRTKLRESDATFKVVKNSLTERAADQAGADTLKEFLSGPTALTFVRGDVATAAKAVADYARATQLLPFKGGLMDGSTLDVDQIRSLSRLPSREVLYGQLVGVVASPVTGLVRTLGALVSGLAVALGQVQAKKESGEIPAGPVGHPSTVGAPDDTPAAEAATPESANDDRATDAAGAVEEAPVEEAPVEEAPVEEAAEEVPAADGEAQTELEQSEPAEDDNQADVSAAEAQPEDAETNPTKED
jgi:large subunit ribosomal protein L10